MDLVNLNSFLAFGYFLDYRHPRYAMRLPAIDKGKYADASEHDLVDEGARLFRKAIHAQCVSGDRHLVPLSGGLDSRAILAALVELTDARNIYTYTFGTPGTLDYEIGCAMARRLGTNHTVFDLTQHRFTTNEEMEVSRRTGLQTILFHHQPIFEVEKRFGGCVFWSGAIIDVYFGIHTHTLQGATVTSAKQNSYRENLFVKSTSLTNVDFDAFLPKTEYDASTDGILVREHCIDLLNRQLKMVAAHVLMAGFDYRVLFTDDDLVRFALNIDNRWLNHQVLYRKMLLQAFPACFAYPTKTTLGLPLTASRLALGVRRVRRKIAEHVARTFRTGRVHPGTNYIDFATGIRERSDLRAIVTEHVSDLDRRGVVDWVPCKSLLERHMSGRANHADALIVLASLEMHLKNGKVL
ncbi:MAG: asparagine synthase C-terminal domain-containing protein [Gammaproteobacteria bacterium]